MAASTVDDIRFARPESKFEDIALNPTNASTLLPEFSRRAERRSKERIYNPFPAVVEGIDTNGRHFKISTVLDNLCKDGLYLRMTPIVSVGSQLTIDFYLHSDSASASAPACVHASGIVLRIEEKIGGAVGVAVQINPARFV